MAKENAIFELIIGAILLLSASVSVASGKTLGRGCVILTRKDDPKMYYITVGSHFIFGIATIGKS